MAMMISGISLTAWNVDLQIRCTARFLDCGEHQSDGASSYRNSSQTAVNNTDLGCTGSIHHILKNACDALVSSRAIAQSKSLVTIFVCRTIVVAQSLRSEESVSTYLVLLLE